jgi:hypothetical protein
MKLIYTVLLIFFSISLHAQFAAKFEVLVTGGQTVGEYGLEGIFTNDEPVKDRTTLEIYNFDSLKVNETYFIDLEGRQFLIVAKQSAGPNLGLPYIEVDRIGNNLDPPTVGIGALSALSSRNKYYMTSSLPLPQRTKIQRINADRGPRTEEKIASFIAGAELSVYTLPFQVDSTKSIKVYQNTNLQPLDPTSDGTGIGNVYYKNNNIIWKYSPYVAGDHIIIYATKRN